MTIAVLFAEVGGPFDLRVKDGFARGDGGELRETVQQGDFFFIEVIGDAIIARFGCIRETDRAGRDQLHRPDAAFTGGERLPERFAIRAERGNDADAGDGNAPQASPLLRGFLCQ